MSSIAGDHTLTDVLGDVARTRFASSVERRGRFVSDFSLLPIMSWKWSSSLQSIFEGIDKI